MPAAGAPSAPEITLRTPMPLGFTDETVAHLYSWTMAKNCNLRCTFGCSGAVWRSPGMAGELYKS